MNNTLEYNRDYYLKHKEKILKRRQERYRQDRERFLSIQHKYYQKHKEQIRFKAIEKRKKIRFMILEKLGGKCSNCGIDDFRVLQIDHVNGGGVREIKNFGGRNQEFFNNILNDKSGKYQLLCANCNWIKRYNRNETTLGRSIPKAVK